MFPRQQHLTRPCALHTRPCKSQRRSKDEEKWQRNDTRPCALHTRPCALQEFSSPLFTCHTRPCALHTRPCALCSHQKSVTNSWDQSSLHLNPAIKPCLMYQAINRAHISVVNHLGTLAFCLYYKLKFLAIFLFLFFIFLHIYILAIYFSATLHFSTLQFSHLQLCLFFPSHLTYAICLQ